MTLIACTLNHNAPVLVGDMLISSSDAMISIKLPTNAFDISPYLTPNNNLYPVGLNQKIYIVKKNLCIALAGDVNEMKILLKEFMLRCSYYKDEDIDESHINAFLNEYKLDQQFSDSAFFIMLIKNGDNGYVNVSHIEYPTTSWNIVENEIFEKTYACGSGKATFLHQIHEQDNFSIDAQKGEIGRAISLNVAFLAKLLAEEKVTLHAINENWGGGFETIFYNGNSFVKFDEIAYIVSKGFFDETGEISFPIPQVVMYYKYYNDLLLVSSIEIQGYERKNSQGSTIITSKNYTASFNIVPRIDRKERISKNELPFDLSFETSRIAVAYAFITNSNVVYVPSFFSLSKNKVNVIYLYNESIQITINKEFEDKIVTKAKEVFTNL